MTSAVTEMSTKVLAAGILLLSELSSLTLWLFTSIVLAKKNVTVP